MGQSDFLMVQMRQQKKACTVKDRMAVIKGIWIDETYVFMNWLGLPKPEMNQ
jgi:hypothetical protein